MRVMVTIPIILFTATCLAPRTALNMRDSMDRISCSYRPVGFIRLTLCASCRLIRVIVVICCAAIPSNQAMSAAGISETFSLSGHRSLYGATKLAAELLVEEYRAMYGLRTVINRCGVVSGPWQMGKIDQGFVVLWLSRYLFGGPLSYMGFGGHGFQVRDVLHVDDLYDLIVRQLKGLRRILRQFVQCGWRYGQ